MTWRDRAHFGAVQFAGRNTQALPAPSPGNAGLVVRDKATGDLMQSDGVRWSVIPAGGQFRSIRVGPTREFKTLLEVVNYISNDPPRGDQVEFRFDNGVYDMPTEAEIGGKVTVSVNSGNYYAFFSDTFNAGDVTLRSPAEPASNLVKWQVQHGLLEFWALTLDFTAVTSGSFIPIALPTPVSAISLFFSVVNANSPNGALAPGLIQAKVGAQVYLNTTTIDNGGNTKSCLSVAEGAQAVVMGGSMDNAAEGINVASGAVAKCDAAFSFGAGLTADANVPLGQIQSDGSVVFKSGVAPTLAP